MSLALLVTRSAYASLVGDRVVVGVQHPAWFFWEIDARWTEDVDQLVPVGTDGLRRVNAGRWNDRDGRRSDSCVIVVEPCGQVRSPGEANVVHVLTLQHQRTLLEVVMAVGRE